MLLTSLLFASFGPRTFPPCWFAHFEQAVVIPDCEPRLALDAQVQLIQTLSVPLNIEIGDRPGDHPQEVYDRPDVQECRLWEGVELLDRLKAPLVEGGIDIPPLPLLRPGRDRSLQDIGQGGWDGGGALRGQ